jgi:hypothetical protein
MKVTLRDVCGLRGLVEVSSQADLAAVGPVLLLRDGFVITPDFINSADAADFELELACLYLHGRGEEEEEEVLDTDCSRAATTWLAETRSCLLERENKPLAARYEQVGRTLERLVPRPDATPAGVRAPAPAPVPARNWFSFGLLLRLFASTFFMMQNPSRMRVYSISLAVFLHLLEMTGLGLALLSMVHTICSH